MFFVLDEVESTNLTAFDYLSDGQQPPFSVIAKRQFGGRGRLGASWESTCYGNLYMSIALEPGWVHSSMWPFLSLFVGFELQKNLKQLKPNGDFLLKWPNDLYHDGGKCAGILIEGRWNGCLPQAFVVGIGVNLNSAPQLNASSSYSASAVLEGQEPDFSKTLKFAKGISFTYHNQRMLHSAWNNFPPSSYQSIWLYRDRLDAVYISSGFKMTGELRLKNIFDSTEVCLSSAKHDYVVSFLSSHCLPRIRYESVLGIVLLGCARGCCDQGKIEICKGYSQDEVRKLVWQDLCQDLDQPELKSCHNWPVEIY